MKTPWYARAWAAIKWIAGIIAVAALGYGAYTVLKSVRRAARGLVVGPGRRFAPDPTHKTRILVEDDDGPIPVELPEGFVAEDVLAVGIAEETGTPVVEVLHAKKDRRARLRGSGG